MSVEVLFACGGCDAKVTGRVRRESVPMFPGSDLCIVRTDRVESVAPEGWVVFDPYTHMTYCPECWADICEPEPDSGEGTPSKAVS